MKYVNNAYSTKMLQENLCISQTIISEKEFMELSHNGEYTSVIGHPDTAKLFNLPENRQTLILQDGDELLVCELNNPTGTRLPVGITKIEEIPNGFFFRFLQIKVFKQV